MAARPGLIAGRQPDGDVARLDMGGGEVRVFDQASIDGGVGAGGPGEGQGGQQAQGHAAREGHALCSRTNRAEMAATKKLTPPMIRA
ncbi:hypothetical protein D3C80_1602930 [compost metagenome]